MSFQSKPALLTRIEVVCQHVTEEYYYNSESLKLYTSQESIRDLKTVVNRILHLIVCVYFKNTEKQLYLFILE